MPTTTANVRRWIASDLRPAAAAVNTTVLAVATTTAAVAIRRVGTITITAEVLQRATIRLLKVPTRTEHKLLQGLQKLKLEPMLTLPCIHPR